MSEFAERHEIRRGYMQSCQDFIKSHGHFPVWAFHALTKEELGAVWESLIPKVREK